MDEDRVKRKSEKIERRENSLNHRDVIKSRLRWIEKKKDR